LPFAPSRASFGWAIVIVLTSALATAFLVALRVLRLDLVAVLKARD
jgi:putative ABC transport system permease protein